MIQWGARNKSGGGGAKIKIGGGNAPCPPPPPLATRLYGCEALVSYKNKINRSLGCRHHSCETVWAQNRKMALMRKQKNMCRGGGTSATVAVL